MAPVNSVHDNTNPQITRLTHYALAVMIVALILAVPAWLIIGLTNERAVLFIVMVIPTILFLPALVFLSVTTPPVTVSAEGLLLRPYVWRQRLIDWQDVTLAKPYPLLPASESEVMRRALVGRKKYAPAEGLMVLVPGLPWPYRIAGYFAGERGTPIVAFTNRAHQDYATLAQAIRARCEMPTPAPTPAPALKTSSKPSKQKAKR
jgi:hypothetical protein